MNRSTVGAKLSRLVAEVQSFPVTFKHMPSVAKKVDKALDLGGVPPTEGKVLKPSLVSRAKVRKYEGAPITVRFDGVLPKTLV